MPSDILQAIIVEDDQKDINLLQGALKEIRVPRADVVRTVVPLPGDSLESLRSRFRDALSPLGEQGKPQLVFLDILFRRPDGPDVPWGRNLAQDAREIAPNTAVLLYTKLSEGAPELVELRCESLFDGCVYKGDLYRGEATLRRAGKTLLGSIIERALKTACHRQPQASGASLDLKRIVQRFRQIVRLADDDFGVKLPDEPATQKFLYLLLLASFENVTKEDPLSKRGAKSTRADFVIRDIGTLVELKYISEKGHIQRIQDEISADLPQYKDREGISTIAFLIYDPKDLCHERDALKHLLESQDSRIVVYFL